MMNNIWTIFLYELWRGVRRKGYLFATFGIPALMFVLMFGYNAIQSLQEPTPAEDILSPFDFEGIQQAGYVDASGLFAEVPEALQEMLIPYPDEAAARAAMQSGEVDVFYIISPDYLESGDVTLHLPSFSLSLLNNGPIEQLVYRTLAADAKPELLRRLSDPVTIVPYNLQRDGDAAQDEDADFLMIYVFTIVFLMALFLTNTYLMQTVIEEKENKLIEILVTTVTPTQLLAGKILAMSLLGIAQILVWVGALLLALRLVVNLEAFSTVTVLLNIRVQTDMLPLMLVYFILGYLLFAAVYAGVGALAGSLRESSQYVALVTIIAVLPFYFFTLFVQTPNAPIAVGLSLFPITAPIAMMMRLNITTVPPLEVATSLGLLVIFVIILMWVAGRLFRVQTLLSGKFPSLRDIPKLIRG